MVLFVLLGFHAFDWMIPRWSSLVDVQYCWMLRDGGSIGMFANDVAPCGIMTRPSGRAGMNVVYPYASGRVRSGQQDVPTLTCRVRSGGFHTPTDQVGSPLPDPTRSDPTREV